MHNYIYEILNDGTIKITRYIGNETDIIMPQYIDNYLVTAIGMEIFSKQDNIWDVYESHVETIILPDSVLTIDDFAFSQCRYLKYVKLSHNLRSIGQSAFCGCENLREIYIPENVSYIGDEIDKNCTQLEAIVVDEHNEYYLSIDGVLFDKNLARLYCYPAHKKDRIYQIPKSVQIISERAFAYNEYIQEIKIFDSIIDNYAFYACRHLEKVIMRNVAIIRQGAFELCGSLKMIQLPKSIREIGLYVFKECYSLSNIYIDKENPYYYSHDGILYNKDKTRCIIYPSGKKNKQYTLLKTIQYIDHHAFRDNQYIETMMIHSGVISIGDFAFYHCSQLKYMDIADTVTHIGEYAFGDCDSLENVIWPRCYVSRFAFNYCRHLNHIQLNDDIKSIGDFAFSHCYSLEKLIIPQSVQDIGRDILYDSQTILYVYEHSYALTYAQKNHIPYVIIKG
ncbi:MAG: leucine-rich repeat domain-containing protein [Erysipelotrichaceae bacterium]|nr:leucine-rich repeat domain-containing protein [Erysipelotrichaceae bacterium]